MKVNVYQSEEEAMGSGYYYDSQIIARVNYNERLDYWDGSNWTNGGVGLHKGITKLRKPHDPKMPYVIIIGSQWQGSKDFGYAVTALEAAQEICRAGCEREDWVWPEIKEIIENLEDSEEE